MNLIFKEKFNEKDNYFVLKIWGSIKRTDEKLYYKNNNEYYHGYWKKTGQTWGEYCPKRKPKKHSIRADEKNRWKVGAKIHFVVNPYNKKRFQFAPVLRVTTLQKILIITEDVPETTVFVDDRKLNSIELKELVFNDGFDCLEDFTNYFKGEDFKGKIIHWTQNSNY